MTEVVLREIEDGGTLRTFDRPDRLNAWTAEMQTRYFDLLDDCAAREDVRAIVLTGAGRGFCAGVDMQNWRRSPEARWSRRVAPMTHGRSPTRWAFPSL